MKSVVSLFGYKVTADRSLLVFVFTHATVACWD